MPRRPLPGVLASLFCGSLSPFFLAQLPGALLWSPSPPPLTEPQHVQSGLLLWQMSISSACAGTNLPPIVFESQASVLRRPLTPRREQGAEWRATQTCFLSLLFSWVTWGSYWPSKASIFSCKMGINETNNYITPWKIKWDDAYRELTIYKAFQ